MILGLSIILPFTTSMVSGSLFKQCALMIPTYSHQTCVTYEDLNAAFDDARSKLGIPPVGEKFTLLNVTPGFNVETLIPQFRSVILDV